MGIKNWIAQGEYLNLIANFLLPLGTCSFNFLSWFCHWVLTSSGPLLPLSAVLFRLSPYLSLCKYTSCTVVDPGFPREGASPGVGANLLFGQFSLRLKFWAGGARPSPPPQIRQWCKYVICAALEINSPNTKFNLILQFIMVKMRLSKSLNSG